MKQNNKDIRGLMNSWVFNLANYLMEEYCRPRKEAFRQAYLVRELLEALGKGVVTFEYEKQDGTLREARGTLCHGISEKYDNYMYKTDMTATNKNENESVFVYWDLDREAFRTFSAMKLRRIKTTNK